MAKRYWVSVCGEERVMTSEEQVELEAELYADKVSQYERSPAYRIYSNATELASAWVSKNVVRRGSAS